MIPLEPTELKKLFYKSEVSAFFVRMKKGIVYYIAYVQPSEDEEDTQTVHFNIPIADMGDGEFKDHMPAKLLIRWMLS